MATSEGPIETAGKTAAEDFLAGGGEMGKLIQSMDWSQSPLGPLESWPQSLRTTLSLCLASNFPLCFAWGPERIQIYNDGYWPICGAKHPTSMGQDYRECWFSAWPVIGPGFERCMATGETTFLTDSRMFLDRNGYLEETFFTFSYSPIRDETGAIAGIFHPVNETTHLVLAERRMSVLRALADRTANTATIDDALRATAAALAEHTLDLPFALLYRFDRDEETATLAGTACLTSGTAAAPLSVRFEEVADDEGWPLHRIFLSGQSERIEDLATRFGPLDCGPYEESPKSAMAFPIALPGAERPTAVLIVGVSPRRALDHAYRSFFGMVATATGTAVANAYTNEEEKRRAEALAELDRAKSTFFSNVSHELRTPLTLMLGPLEDALSDVRLPADRRDQLDLAHRNSLRLLKLVNALLDFSRIEAGRLQADYEPTDLATYTAELASVFRSAIEKVGLLLVVDCPLLPEPVYVDRDMWEKVVLNLLSNALKFTFEGEIRVSLRWRGERVELSVSDTGVGIPPEELPRVFERFHRVHGARSRTHEGTGIGLALTQELARIHGGDVTVHSVKGRGSSFIVSIRTGEAVSTRERSNPKEPSAGPEAAALPFLQEVGQWRQAGPETTSGEPALPIEAGAAKPRILLADDNADMREYVLRILSGRFDVVAVPDGQAALEEAQHQTPDLILSDVMMPRLDGFGLLQAVRNDPKLRAVSMILLSARAGEESRIEGLHAGADDYLVKPFSARELIARIATHLEMNRLRREAAAGEQYRLNEEALLESQSELEQKVTDRTEELSQANRDLDQFAHSVAHDLRSPLRTIVSTSRFLLEDAGDRLAPDERQMLERQAKSGLRLARIVDDLLGFAQLANAAPQKSVFDFSERATAAAEETIERRKSRCQVDVQPGMTASGDPNLLGYVLTNLLDNAIKFSPEGGKVTISEVNGVFSVRDEGVGFDMKYADKLFKAFVRLVGQDAFEGTGLGLANVARIVEKHGGRIWAESQPGMGATFSFTLG